VYHALCEQNFTEVAVINPAHAKALRGHKTDAKDGPNAGSHCAFDRIERVFSPGGERG